MKKATLLSLTLFIIYSTFAQTLNLQTGASFSKLDLELFGQGTNFYNKTISSPLLFVGLQYLEKKYFDLSSNIGYLRKGGHETYAYYSGNGTLAGATFSLDYLSLNTTLNFKYPGRSGISPFLSIGPRFDYLLHSEDTYVAFHQQPLKKVSFGLLVGAGIRYTVSRLQFSVRGDYFPNSTKIYTDGDETLYDRTFAVSASIGYRLSQKH